jgi:putative ABC transport system permease protein
VHLSERDIMQTGSGGNTSAENAYDWQRMSRSFAAMGLYSTFSMTLTGAGDASRVDVANVTPGMFAVFGVAPAIGRAITHSDTVQGAPTVAVLSHDFWRARLGGDPNVVGRTLQLNFNEVRIVGVLPARFHGPQRLDRPLWLNFVNDTSDGRGGRSKNVFALLKPGVSVEQAQDEMTRVARQLEAMYPNHNKGQTIEVQPVSNVVFGEVTRPLYLLFGASALVLLIACANISNLLVARGIARSRELAMRAALGADRGRLTRQLLTESLLLSAFGALGGIALAAAAAGSLTAMGPDVFAIRPPTLDVKVLSFCVVLAVFTTLVFGLIPAVRATRGGLYDALRESGRVTRGAAGRTRRTLALAQLSLAVVLLSASALVLKSFAKVLRVEPGVRGDNMLYGEVWLPRMRYDSTRSIPFYAELERRLNATPGVRAVGFTSQVPFSGYLDRIGISRIGGRPQLSGSEAPEADRYVVSPSYFQTMGIKLLRGRLLTGDDRYDNAPVAVVDEAFARRAFGEANPIGQTMKLPLREEFATIVGVVSHVKTYGLDVASPGQIYMSNAQYPWRWLSIIVRTTGEPEQFQPTLARVVQGIDSDQPLANVSTMERAMSNQLRSRRFALTLLGAFGAVAIVLAAIGLYGVIAYGVTQRRREIGVRVALGARATQIARMVLAEAGGIAVLGAAIGSVAAFAVARVMSSLLFEVDPRDPVLLGGVAVGLVAVAMLACLLPARRAMLVNPSEVLRGD